HGKHILQIGHIKANTERLKAVINLDFVLGIFLICINIFHLQQIVFQVQLDAFELVCNQNGCNVQTALQRFAIDVEMTRVVAGDNPLEVWELAFDKLGNQFNVAKGETNLV